MEKKHEDIQKEVEHRTGQIGDLLKRVPDLDPDQEDAIKATIDKVMSLTKDQADALSRVTQHTQDLQDQTKMTSGLIEAYRKQDGQIDLAKLRKDAETMHKATFNGALTMILAAPDDTLEHLKSLSEDHRAALRHRYEEKIEQLEQELQGLSIRHKFEEEKAKKGEKDSAELKTNLDHLRNNVRKMEERQRETMDEHERISETNRDELERLRSDNLSLRDSIGNLHTVSAQFRGDLADFLARHTRYPRGEEHQVKLQLEAWRSLVSTDSSLKQVHREPKSLAGFWLWNLQIWPQHGEAPHPPQPSTVVNALLRLHAKAVADEFDPDMISLVYSLSSCLLRFSDIPIGMVLSTVGTVIQKLQRLVFPDRSRMGIPEITGLLLVQLCMQLAKGWGDCQVPADDSTHAVRDIAKQWQDELALFIGRRKKPTFMALLDQIACEDRGSVLANALETNEALPVSKPGTEPRFGDRHYIRVDDDNEVCLVRTLDLDSYVMLYGPKKYHLYFVHDSRIVVKTLDSFVIKGTNGEEIQVPIDGADDMRWMCDVTHGSWEP